MHSEISFQKLLGTQNVYPFSLTTKERHPDKKLSHPVFKELKSFEANQHYFQERLNSGAALAIIQYNVETLTDTASALNTPSLLPIAERLTVSLSSSVEVFYGGLDG